MNAAQQPEPVEIDLLSVDAWSYHQQDGRTDPNVIVSGCGRFTVVRYPHDGVFLAHRCYPREQRRMSEVIDGAQNVAAGVDLCVARAAHEAGA